MEYKQNPKISISEDIKKELDKLRVGDESYQSVISRLIESYKKKGGKS